MDCCIVKTDIIILYSSFVIHLKNIFFTTFFTTVSEGG